MDYLALVSISFAFIFGISMFKTFIIIDLIKSYSSTIQQAFNAIYQSIEKIYKLSSKENVDESKD